MGVVWFNPHFFLLFYQIAPPLILAVFVQPGYNPAHPLIQSVIDDSSLPGQPQDIILLRFFQYFQSLKVSLRFTPAPKPEIAGNIGGDLLALPAAAP